MQLVCQRMRRFKRVDIGMRQVKARGGRIVRGIGGLGIKGDQRCAVVQRMSFEEALFKRSGGSGHSAARIPGGPFRY